MPVEIIRQDITKMSVDAVVNAANESLLGGGGVDGAIHRAAGPGLDAECRTLGGCPTGEARITGGYLLPAKFVIHAVGPVWRGGGHGEKELLASCYRNSLALAEEHGCASVAFPLISSGIFGYPKDQAIRVALDSIREYLDGSDSDIAVYLTVFDRSSFDIGKSLYRDLKSFVDDNYVAPFEEEQSRRFLSQNLGAPAAGAAPFPDRKARIPRKKIAEDQCFAAAEALPPRAEDLKTALEELDESFSTSLLRLIDKSGMTDSQCYKRANIDRKLFSKIRSDPNYRPSKPTAVAFAVALRLDLEETESLLKKAGFALSHSSKADVIVEYFIKNKNYDIMQINEALFAFDQSLLGAAT